MMSFYLSGGVEVLGFISPTEPTDEYPVIDPLYGIDGFRNVNTLSELNSIPNLRRRPGMVVGVSGGTQYYKLNPSPWNGAITDWSLFQTGGGTFTGGTVTGDTIFTQGVTATTFSASTYLGLPLDVYVTGFTYQDNTFTILDTSGNTFTATINDVTGLTVNGILSATTYQNLPQDIFVTGGTYTNGEILFKNNSGGSFTVTGLPIGGAGGQVYYLNLSQTQTPYQEFSPIGTNLTEQTTGVTINSGVTSTIASFLTPSGYPNTTTIPAGYWSFYLHSYKDVVNASFDIFCEVYTYTTGGTETLILTTEGADVTTYSPTVSMELTDGYYSGGTIDITDRILVKVRTTNNGSQTNTLSFFTEGQQHYSYGITPFSNFNALTCETLSGCTTIVNLENNKVNKGGDTMTGTLNVPTISATTYQNLPIDPDTYVTGFTYNGNVFTVKQNNGQPDLTATINSVTGLTVNGNLTVTGNTSMLGNLTLTSQNVPPTPTVSIPFIDDYNRLTLSPGGTPSLTYTNTNTGNGNSTIVTNYLNINNGNVAGRSYTTVPLSGFDSPFNPTLSSNNPLSTIEWTFNLRTNRSSIFSGFGAGQYGGAVVLVGSNTNILSLGSGYALVYGTTASRNWKLVKYNNGLTGTQTDVIAGGTFAGNTNYVSVRILYSPSTNTWTYYFRDDGAVAWGDPTTTNTLIGTAVDSTYTSTLMNVFGVFFNYSTAASQNLQFDNLRVQQTITPTFTPVDEIIVKNNSGTDVLKVKDDGSVTTSGSVTSTSGFFGSFSGTQLGNGTALILGQSGIMVTGTSQLNLTNLTNTLTLIPGLSTTITVGTQTMVYIQTNGGVNTLATTTTGGSALDIAIIVDGAVLAAGGYQRIYADNPTGVGLANVPNWVANWNTSVILTLSSGTHTIEVDAVYVSGSNASVSGGATTIKQGTLTVMVLKNI